MRRSARSDVTEALKQARPRGALVQRLFNKFVQSLDFTIGDAAACMVGDRQTERKRPDEWRAVTNAGADGFAEARQFFRELPSFERAKVHPIWNKSGQRPAISAGASGLYDRQRLRGRVYVQAGWRAWHQNQVGDGDRCAERAVARRSVDKDQIGGHALHLANPVADCLTLKHNLINRKTEIARFRPLAARPLRVAINKGDIEPTAARFAGETNRNRGFADAAFALRDRDSLGQWRTIAVSKSRRLSAS